MIGIDIDGPEGQRLLEEISGGDLPATQAFCTSRGMRLQYAIQPSMVVKTWAVRCDRSEVKILGEGSLTVMPPSRHSSGKRYRWVRGHAPSQGRLAAAPAWTRKPRATYKERTEDRLVASGHAQPIPEGQRNERLFKIACAMRRHGCEFDEILHALSFINQQRCRPPLTLPELKGVSASVMRYQPVQGHNVSTAQG
jgi:hypothetical protein